MTGVSPRRLSVLIADGADALERDVRRRQELMQAIRSATHPVVVAPYGSTLGAGAELMLAAARVVAHVELYAGLNEASFGLLPSGSGIAALLRRWVNPVATVVGADPLPQLAALFDLLMSGKISAGATEAQSMKLLDACDTVVMGRDALLETAKREAVHLAAGYRPPRVERIWSAGKDAYQALVARYEATTPGARSLKIAHELASVLTGVTDASPGWVDERVILDRERTAFLALATDSETLVRIDAASGRR
jgi:3-hydroxyacyl-CoA dehydrogenase